jgi:hypothetical protein
VFDELDFPYYTSSTPPLHLLQTLSWRLFPDQVVQPPLSIFPFPVGYPGAPPPLPVPSITPRAALAPSPALSAGPTPSAAPHAAPTPSHATSATPMPSPTPRMAPSPSLVPSTAPALPPAPRAASQVPANYAPLMHLRAPLDGSTTTTTTASSLCGSHRVPPADHPSDPRHTHPMVTQQAVGVLRPVTLSTTEGNPGISPIPSSVRAALADPHRRRAMEEEYDC